jgi:hypothetical protein
MISNSKGVKCGVFCLAIDQPSPKCLGLILAPGKLCQLIF